MGSIAEAELTPKAEPGATAWTPAPRISLAGSRASGCFRKLGGPFYECPYKMSPTISGLC